MGCNIWFDWIIDVLWNGIGLIGDKFLLKFKETFIRVRIGLNKGGLVGVAGRCGCLS